MRGFNSGVGIVVFGALTWGALLAAGLAAGPSPGPAGRPLFARVTVLEVEGVEGPYEPTITISVIHRSPWYPRYKLTFPAVAKGKPSAWVDLSEKLSDSTDVTTAVLTLSAGGKPVKAHVRARVEVARSPRPAKPLASVEVSDPGGQLGFILPERGLADAQIAERLMSIRQVARRHLEASAAVAVAPEDRPKRFVAVTRCIPYVGYTDPEIARMEVQAVLNLGYNTLTDLPAELAKAMGVPYVAGAEYRPPGVSGPEPSEKALREHYARHAEALRKSYGSTDKLRAFAMSDEPNWDFPQTSERLNGEPGALERFRRYLRGRGLSAAQLGRATWEEVRFVGPPPPGAPLPERRLWYHTVQFAGLDQIRRYAAATRALEAELGRQVLAFTNWNNPGIIYSNVKPWHAGDFTASHHWFEFSRARASGCLWLGPSMAEGGGWHRSTFRAWSMAVELLRCAARQGVGRFGAYIHHGPLGDDRGFEVALSIMSVAGHGGAGYNSWIWGPHYAFTEWMWSEKFGHYEAVADANRLIGRSEHLMAGASPPKAQVALLWPFTSQMYDLNKGGYWTYNRDFLVEMEQVWFALNHYNFPVDFVDETMVQEGALDNYKVLYLTGPNLERKTASAIARWVEGGGALWSCAGAGTRDEYNEPMHVLDPVLGVTGRSRQKDHVDYSPKGGLRWLEPRGKVSMDPEAGLGAEPWEAYGSRASFKLAGAQVIGRFEDGAPAVVRNRHGDGLSLHFATMPGLAYSRGATEKEWEPTVDYPPRIARLITALPERLGVPRPARTSLRFVEAAVLQSERGVAVTLLNWSAKPIEELVVTLSGMPEGLGAVRSARLGQLAFERHGDELTVKLPMPKVVDVLLVEFPGQ